MVLSTTDGAVPESQLKKHEEGRREGAGGDEGPGWMRGWGGRAAGGVELEEEEEEQQSAAASAVRGEEEQQQAAAAAVRGKEDALWGGRKGR